jgi:protein-S-isoprenylcysteine O-methyltransferase
MDDTSLTTQLVRWAWLAIGVVWLVGAFASKRTVRSGTLAVRLLEIGCLGAAFSALFNPALEWRILPNAALLAWVGVLVTFAGVGLAIWARVILGRNWSANAAVKVDHSLVCSGPYAIVRHPIYAGMLMASLGTAVAFGRAACFLAPPLLLLAWRRKAQVEEEFMRGQFGEQYVRYTQRVKGLIPYVW